MSEFVITTYVRRHFTLQKRPHLSSDSIIGYITHMSAGYNIRCILLLVLL